MEGGDGYRHWDELIPDALGLIFSNLSLQEILTLRNGLPVRILFSFLVFASAASLQTLRIPRSDISDSIVEQIAGKLSTITFLDVSYCTKISGCALEAIGKHCKLLAGLCRNMHPLDTEGMETQDDEAHAIATMMPKLKRLEMAYHLVSTEGLLQILSSCTELEFMDLRGCWNVNLDDKFLKESLPKLTVLRPLVMEDFYVTNDWEEFSDDSDYDDQGELEELERMYETGDVELFGWYPSP
ncbi:hypothetical protein DKX38_007988 [Salix brachista]|uniref:F-box domain-containing protein n=1 Tax=Salix brachista TaxID=2182728 RepID=A0A5N5MPU1_9ROSI|nr:hypothetical protein DKX38_007988 [Salix brachista]